MIIIGLTGSIGMGKSFVADLMKNFNCITLNADTIAHNFLNSQEVKNHFPEAIVNNTIDRKLLGNIVFNDENKLFVLEKIIHPKVEEFYLKNIQYFKMHKLYNYLVIEAPLLFESKLDRLCDYVINVRAPFYIQKKRVLKRNKIDEKQLQNILKRQISSKHKSELADFTINSSLGKNFVLKQLKNIFEEIDATFNS
ncbi:MAG: dephospho-CoA kinase [Sphingobacteriia bacterium]|nr:dephospho-CoA kinase [Sphingobacteriia bacterium]